MGRTARRITADEAAALVRPGMWLDFGAVLGQPDAFDTTARQRDTLNGVIALSMMQSRALWNNTRERRITAATPRYAGRILRGTSEFAGLSGSFSETWKLDGINPDGSTHGRIILSTLSERVE